MKKLLLLTILLVSCQKDYYLEDLNEAEALIQSLQNDKGTLYQEINDLNTSLTNSITEGQTLNNTISDLEATIIAANEIHEGVLTEYNQLIIDIETTTESLTLSQIDVGHLRDHIANIDEVTAELVQENNVLTTRVKIQQASLATQYAQLQALIDKYEPVVQPTTTTAPLAFTSSQINQLTNAGYTVFPGDDSGLTYRRLNVGGYNLYIGLTSNGFNTYDVKLPLGGTTSFGAISSLTDAISVLNTPSRHGTSNVPDTTAADAAAAQAAADAAQAQADADAISAQAAADAVVAAQAAADAAAATPTYNNDCGCDTSDGSGFLVTPGDVFDINNFISFGYWGNFEGSIYSSGNEARATMYALNGSVLIVGDKVYDANGNYIPNGTYTKTGNADSDITNPELNITYVIGDNGTISSITTS